MQFLFAVFLLGLLSLVTSDVSEQHFDPIVTDFFELSNQNISAFFADYNEPQSKPSNYERRWAGAPPAPASNDLWEKAKCKGRKFIVQMSYSDYDVGQMLPVPQNTAQSPWYFGE
jgi:hypothetical protein